MRVGRRDDIQAKRNDARHPHRPISPPLESRRAAAAHQRPEGRDVDRRPATARAGARQGRDEDQAYSRRHNVRPGITGWAQVNGFRETDDGPDAHRLEHDLYYIENWSLWLDIQILARTVISPKSYRNAY